MSVVHVSSVVSEVIARLPRAARQRVESQQPQQVRTKMRIEQATKRIESLADLQPKPENWRAAMQALIDGAVDYDDIPDVVRGCYQAAAKQWNRERRNHSILVLGTISMDKVREASDKMAGQFQNLDGSESAAVRYRLWADAMEVAEAADAGAVS